MESNERLLANIEMYHKGIIIKRAGNESGNRITEPDRKLILENIQVHVRR